MTQSERLTAAAEEPEQTDWEVPYPFSREEYWPRDEEGTTLVKSWKPGTDRQRGALRCEQWMVEAHGMGACLLHVVSRHKPAGYPERVFYTRQWRDPDGKVFGKRGLRMTTAQAFRALCRGYRYEFTMVQEAVAK